MFLTVSAASYVANNRDMVAYVVVYLPRVIECVREIVWGKKLIAWENVLSMSHEKQNIILNMRYDFIYIKIPLYSIEKVLEKYIGALAIVILVSDDP